MLWFWLAACTIGDRPLVDVPLQITASQGAPLALPDGTELILTEASLELASLTLFEPESEVALVWPHWSGVAHAHPGHEADGDVVADLALGPLKLDLLEGSEAVDGLQIYAGDVATASLLLTGEARFVGSLGETAVELVFPVDQAVPGIPAALHVRADAPPEGLRLSTSAERLLQWAPLDADPGADGVLTTDDSAPLTNALRFGILSASAWTLETL